ncbi:hypothetical protein [Sphingomonas asaccharolytica]|uniref:hypothetical protein n=1 Tax=Sphingomonas asaccharolytica TaxID=40681 RepID=UPI000A7C48DC|nr:hypothetical protein [Sphingomonas asaccharolytica]
MKGISGARDANFSAVAAFATQQPVNSSDLHVSLVWFEPVALFAEGASRWLFQRCLSLRVAIPDEAISKRLLSCATYREW